MDYSQYKQFAVSLAEQAGEIMLANFTLNMKKEWKSNDTPVTDGDIKINDLLISEVQKQFPDHGVLGEEKSDYNQDDEFLWVCDPIDGTFMFAHGIPTCVFSLALLHKGEVVIGVINDPFMKRLYHAEKGKGAFVNDTPIQVNRQSELRLANIGLHHWPEAPYELDDVTNALNKADAVVYGIISITYMGVLVAAGEFTATLFQGCDPHDTAALKVIVEEAGGKVTNLFGEEQQYNQAIKGHIISNGILHDQLVELVRKYPPREFDRYRK